MAPLSDAELAESTPLLGEMTIEDATQIYTQTGVWSMAPIAPVDLDRDRIDNLYVASIDRRVQGYDAVALPDVATGARDRAMVALLPPAPLGTTYERDTRGFVQATPDGALTPEGVLVIAGKPPVLPLVRPGSAPPVAVQPDSATRTALASARPVARPTNLIEQDQRARLGGLSRQELGNIRPVARPASAQSQVASIDQAPTELAVVASRRPLARPGGMAKAVERALAAALANGTGSGSGTGSGRDTDSSGGIATAAAARAPKIPSKASVAREATMENAISLSRINLIGVYGASTDRRALVRLKSGRYVKVQVGDRLDGGKVAAIGERKLQYIKRGRTITLEIVS